MKMPILILSVTGKARELIFVTHSQTMPMLLVQELCFEKQGPILANHGPAMNMPLAVSICCGLQMVQRLQWKPRTPLLRKMHGYT